MSLSIFCLQVHLVLSKLHGTARLDAFFDYRYRILADNYPHEPFGVAQADSEFFLVTYQYLHDVLNIDAAHSGDYKGNYTRWLNMHKSLK